MSKELTKKTSLDELLNSALKDFGFDEFGPESCRVVYRGLLLIYSREIGSKVYEHLGPSVVERFSDEFIEYLESLSLFDPKIKNYGNLKEKVLDLGNQTKFFLETKFKADFEHFPKLIE